MICLSVLHALQRDDPATLHLLPSTTPSRRQQNGHRPLPTLPSFCSMIATRLETSVSSSLKSFTSGSVAKTTSSCLQETLPAVAWAGPSCRMLPGPSRPIGTVKTQSRTAGGNDIIFATKPFPSTVRCRSWSLLQHKQHLCPSKLELAEVIGLSAHAAARSCGPLRRHGQHLLWKIRAERNGQCVVQFLWRQRLQRVLGIAIVEERRGTHVTSLLVYTWSHCCCGRLRHLRTTGSQHHFCGDGAGECQAHLVRHVGLPQQWIDASKPEIVGESKLAEPRLLGNEGLVAIDANIDRFLTARRSCGHAAFVQQNQLHGTVSCAHLDARGLQLCQRDLRPVLMVSIHRQERPNCR